jgi:hypothetical protein
MESKVKTLKVICWVGALADLVFFVAMIVPSMWGWMFGIVDFAPDLQHRVDMGVGAALMLGWTGLLLWVGQDPVGRRGVMALTIFPVLIGLGCTSVAAIASGANAMGNLLWVFGLKIVLFSLLGYGLVVARRIAAQQASSEVG